MTYELYLTTMHCIGRLKHVVGAVDTLAEAEAWISGEHPEGLRFSTVLREDPIAYCPVKHCHMKRQKPAFTYREVK